MAERTAYIGRPGVTGIRVGDGVPCLTVPVFGETKNEITQAWTVAAEAHPDLIEWRVDGLVDPQLENLGLSLRDHFGIPVLVTVRTKKEGGRFPLRQATEKEYERLIEQGAYWADAVDIEYDFSGRDKLIGNARDNGAVVVVSKHVLDRGVDEDWARTLLTEMTQSGADVVKIAWLIDSDADGEKLQGLQRWARDNLSIPTAIMGMGEAGPATRLGESAKLNAFTFAHVEHPSAPGQPGISEVRVSL